MSIKRKIQIIVETLMGRKCENCKHYKGFFCKSPKFTKCIPSIFPIGWEKKEKGRKRNGR